MVYRIYQQVKHPTMRSILLTVLLFSMVACSFNGKSDKGADDEFVRYFNNLKQVPLPFSYNSANEKPTNLTTDYNETVFEKYKQAWTVKPYGRLFKTDKYYATVEISIGDNGPVPYYMTYDEKGDKIDSLNAYDKAGSDIGYNSIEYVIVNASKEITVIDSTTVWKINKEGTDIIPNTDSLSVGKAIYRIEENGKFKKIK